MDLGESRIIWKNNHLLLLAVYSCSKKCKDLETFSKYRLLEGHRDAQFPGRAE